MLIVEIAGGLFVLLFLAAAMSGIEASTGCALRCADGHERDRRQRASVVLRLRLHPDARHRPYFLSGAGYAVVQFAFPSRPRADGARNAGVTTAPQSRVML